MPLTTVEVAFELTVGDTPYFRLDHPTKGKLNNTTYRLAGPIFIDITDAVVNVSVQRGKNRELDRYSSGSATVTLRNENRWFDPLNASSPYVGNIIPRRAIRISTAGVVQFTGVIEDWNLDYDVSGESTAIVTAADAFTLLAQQSLTAGTATAQVTSDRVNAILSMPSVAWPLTQRRIDTGQSLLGKDIFDTADSALSYLQLVEASEQGQLFIDRDGYVRFVNGQVSPTSSAVTATFSDDGTGIAYTSVSVVYGTELLYNEVTVSAPTSTQSWSNTTSQATYGITSTDVSTLLGQSSSVLALAQYWVNKYGEPEYRFDKLQISLDGLSGANANTVLGLELGDLVEVTFTPNKIGSAIQRYGQITSISHDVRADSHNVTLGLGSLQFSFLVLDDTSFGILDEYSLAF